MSRLTRIYKSVSSSSSKIKIKLVASKPILKKIRYFICPR
jgi:hypothetical protein